MLYTTEWMQHDQCLYVVLNTTLRSEDREQKLKQWYLYLRLFLNALYRLPTVRTTAYRGVRLNLGKHYSEGETIVWWGFSECTTSVGVLQSEQFLGNTGDRTMFTIQCQTARNIRKHSYFEQEDAVLLMAGTQFKVIGFLDQRDLHIIQLEETCSPHSLLQPIPIVVPSSTKPISTG
ncbi:unnamed protein product, partial [Rotaria sp. Silwood2]